MQNLYTLDLRNIELVHACVVGAQYNILDELYLYILLYLYTLAVDADGGGKNSVFRPTVDHKYLLSFLEYRYTLYTAWARISVYRVSTRPGNTVHRPPIHNLIVHDYEFGVWNMEQNNG